jgi:hypothetical protein
MGNAAVCFHIEVRSRAPSTDAGEGMLPTFQLGEHGIGDRDTGVVPVDTGELHQLFGMSERQRPEPKSVEDGEDRNGRADPDGQNMTTMKAKPGVRVNARSP